jgi:predicted dehydrogenase
MHAPVRVGVVGFGNFGRLHAQTLGGLAEAELVAIVDTRPVPLAEARSQFSHVSCWDNLAHALDRSGAEAWVVASSTASHIQVTSAILSAGHAVLVEKPIAQSRSAANSIASLVASDSRNLMAGHIVLFNSEFRKLLDEKQKRGPISFIDCVRHRPRTTMDLFPGESPFHLTMVHDLYCVLALMNREEPQHFAAQSHSTADGACDLAVAELQWDCGAIASLTASFLTPAGMAGDGFDRMEIFGRGWAGRILPNPRPIQLWDERATWPAALEISAVSGNPTGMLAEELRCFCRVVRGTDAVPIGATYADAVQVLGWLDQLEASAGIR